MSKFRRFPLLLIIILFLFNISMINRLTHAAPAAASIPVTFTIDTSAERTPISPYIYGTNQDLSGTERWTLRRFGGNRTTGYNWENNASNAGSDWQQSSDDFMCSSLTIP